MKEFNLFDMENLPLIRHIREKIYSFENRDQFFVHYIDVEDIRRQVPCIFDGIPRFKNEPCFSFDQAINETALKYSSIERLTAFCRANKWDISNDGDHMFIIRIEAKDLF